ncbi:MAG: DUF151 domain-containing protein [Chloroflexota bacterium]|nr:DUF151 domain-containing protein [Chloroflexota bacterium]
MAAANATDGELVRASCAGQAAAVSALIDRHWPLVHKLLARAIGNWTEAEDLAQETMFQAVRRLAELREPERFRPWLYTIALNRARLWWRRAPARRFTQSLDTLLVERPVAVERHLAGDGASAEAAWEANDLARAIGRAISALPQEQHRAIVAHYVEGLTYNEIAALLAVPASTVRGRLHHARGRLRRELAQLTSEGYAEFDRPPYAPSGRKRPRRLAMTYVEMVVDYVQSDVHHTSWKVVLKEPGSDRTLPITIGPAEAQAIALRLQESELPRPMSHDLMLSLANSFGASIQEVRVTKLEKETFFAAVVITHDGQTQEIDARASDAIALALRAQVPIYVHTEVKEKAKALADRIEPPTWPLHSASGAPETWVETPVWPPLPDWVAPETRQRLAAWGGKLTVTTVLLVQNARLWAMCYGTGAVTLPHVLMATLSIDGNAARIFWELVSDTNRGWREAIARVFVESDQPRGEEAVWTRETVQLVERAVGAAERLGSTHLGTEHILLGLAEVADTEPESDLAKLFQALELDLIGVREALESAVADATASSAVTRRRIVTMLVDEPVTVAEASERQG